MTLTHVYLRSLVSSSYPKQKWIVFAETMLDAGYMVTLYEARETESKYLTVWNAGLSFKVRFSAHRPNKRKQLQGDCDFFVGITHRGPATTWEDAIEAAKTWLGRPVFAGGQERAAADE